MNLIWLRLIFRHLLLLQLLVVSSTHYAQEIPESYIFYSPSDEQMGSLTILSENSRMFSNSQRLLLLDSNNLHQDTLELEDWSNAGIVQNITVLNDSLFSISFMKEFALISFKNNRFETIERLDNRDLRQNDIKATNFLFLSNAYLGIDIKNKRKHTDYEFQYYDKSFNLINSKKVRLNNTERNDFSYKSISYPHNYYMNNNGELCFSDKISNSFTKLDLDDFKVSVLDLSKEVESDQSIEIFYNKVDSQYYLVKYYPLEGEQTKLRIYNFNEDDFESEVLNDFNVTLNKLNGGFFNGKIMLRDKFKGGYGFYLVPIEDLHKL
ncbi:hypothetical protein [uncultured Marivirga sp.]